MTRLLTRYPQDSHAKKDINKIWLIAAVYYQKFIWIISNCEQSILVSIFLVSKSNSGVHSSKSGISFTLY